jgi:hypothetical protein
MRVPSLIRRIGVFGIHLLNLFLNLLRALA